MFAALFEYSQGDQNAVWSKNKQLIEATFLDILNVLQDTVLSLGSQELRGKPRYLSLRNSADQRFR